MGDNFRGRIKALLSMLNMEPDALMDEEVITLSVDEKLFIYMSELPAGVLLMFCPVGNMPQLENAKARNILSANLFSPDVPKPVLAFDDASDSMICWVQVDLSSADDSKVFQAFEGLLTMSEEWAQELESPTVDVSDNHAGPEGGAGPGVRV